MHLIKHFITIAEKLTKTLDKLKLLNCYTFKNDNTPEMKLIPTTEIKIKYILKYSTAYDGIQADY
jgi:hypothetical protein